jgi:hypothetical protein
MNAAAIKALSSAALQQLRLTNTESPFALRKTPLLLTVARLGCVIYRTPCNYSADIRAMNLPIRTRGDDKRCARAGFWGPCFDAVWGLGRIFVCTASGRNVGFGFGCGYIAALSYMVGGCRCGVWCVVCGGVNGSCYMVF